MKTVALVHEDFANENLNKLLHINIDMLNRLEKDGLIVVRKPHLCYHLRNSKQHNLYKIEYERSISGDLVLLRIVEKITFDSDWSDIDNKTKIILFLIYKYCDSEEIILKIIKKCRKHNIKNNEIVYDTCYAVTDICRKRGGIDETLKKHIINVSRSFSEQYYQLIVTLLMWGFPNLDLQSDFIDTTLEVADQHPNIHVAILKYICRENNIEMKSQYAPVLIDRILKHANELTSYSLMKLVDCCKYFINAQVIMDEIYKQALKRFRRNCKLLYKIAVNYNHNVDRLFDYICRYDKKGKYVISMIEKFPYLNKERAISIISKRADREQLKSVIKNIYDNYMLGV